MSPIEIHMFDKPDEVRNFPNGHIALVHTKDGDVGRSVFEPGWRWSNDVKPIAQTDTCQVRHLGYMLTGALQVEMADGDSFEIGPGSIAMIPPGHDAWVVGDEPAIMIDWVGSTHYASSG